MRTRTEEHLRLAVSVEDAALTRTERDLLEPVGRENRAHLRQRLEDERVGRPTLLGQTTRPDGVPARTQGPKRNAVLEKNHTLIELDMNELEQHGIRASIRRFRRPAGDVIAMIVDCGTRAARPRERRRVALRTNEIR